jgi:hypothetical protein
VLVKPLAETIKQIVVNQWTVVAVIVADGGNRIQTDEFTRGELIRDSVPLEIFEVFGPRCACFDSLFRRHHGLSPSMSRE